MHSLSWQVYIIAEVKAMLRDQTEETSDMKVLEDMEISDLNLETVHAYRNRHMAYRSEHVWEGLTDEEYLERIGAVKRAKLIENFIQLLQGY